MDPRGLVVILLGSFLIWIGVRGTYKQVWEALKPA
jgi:hypothetical protein